MKVGNQQNFLIVFTWEWSLAFKFFTVESYISLFRDKAPSDKVFYQFASMCGIQKTPFGQTFQLSKLQSVAAFEKTGTSE